jgi:hypothetical protein
MTSRNSAMNFDVIPVDPQYLALTVKYLVETGRGLAMLRGITQAQLREIEQMLWDELGRNRAERVAVLVRLHCLIRVFAARRLTDLLLQTGYPLLAPAGRVAARMRLNADLGFNPAEFECALIKELGRIDPALAA